MSMARGSVPGRILLVEDDADINATLCEMLEEEGYEVQAVPNGRAALEALEQLPAPCLVLLDVEMPRMDGYDFLAHLRQHARHAADPVVVVTASRHAPTEVDEVLHKPFDFEVLLDAVERYCEAGPRPDTRWRADAGHGLHAL
ncbi:response regulator [Aggregicoccus sp. 17bor-14]|uniref:response regulator n=1 Tax=Myxococcaceae TaxID=31 RepID=UPI00129D1FF2|nr:MULTISPECIES: response regulator transcription factor [Myxococcaceae]MBF5045283.1 response regulator transcription factor [Simulacricoccus sp. 17bor-14]MRI91024.1 response regulator [Aggregicoccus sp. 17bor-14]